VAGRRPKPTALRVFEGNREKRPLNNNEPYPDKLAPDVPSELEGDEVATVEWRRTIVPAIDRYQITEADRVSAISHCRLWSLWLSQMAKADTEPHVLVGSKRILQNPTRGMAHKTLTMLIKIDAELGLTPSSRSRVTVPGGKDHAKPKDKWAGLL
jgi:P27 family predicted phage terminase small subunit